MDNSTQDNASRHFKISYDTYVVINAYMNLNKKINAIKTFREAVGCGLKEAKIAVEKRWQAPEHIHENAYDIIVTDIPENPMDALLRMLNES
jgi:ribosomal protein L7/L12